MVIGHECAGIIEEVGSEVKTLVPGDRVALEPGISCWRCDYCKEGSYNLCPDMKFFATPPIHGSLANQVKKNTFFTYCYSFLCSKYLNKILGCFINVLSATIRMSFAYHNMGNNLELSYILSIQHCSIWQKC